MRLRSAVAVAATSLVGAGTAALAAGRYGSEWALRSAAAGPPPEPLVAVRALVSGGVVLERTPSSSLPGVYGLTAPGTHAAIGPEMPGADGVAPSITRRLLRVDQGGLEPGDLVRLTPQVHRGDPRGALGLDFTEVAVAGEYGPLPAWFVPGARRTWVIVVHGAGARREQALNVMPLLHGFRFPQLVVSYRGDPGAPPSPDRRAHFGETEWRDLDAAMRHAVAEGATRLVLYGWGTGATMALRAAESSGERGRVGGLVLDSPLLDWRAAVRSVVSSRGLPTVLASLALRAAEGRAGPYADPPPADPTRPPDVPALVVHGPGDGFAPWTASRELVRRRPETVALHTVPDAPHAAMWNADPALYEETLRRFLTPLM